MDELLGLLSEIDRKTEALSQASGLRCPPQCGNCCRSPTIEVSPFELAPLVQRILESGRTDEVLARLGAVGPGAPCVIYEADPADPARGRCSEYAVRPSLCRLYGFAARWNRSGSRELVDCPTHKSFDPAAVTRAEELAADQSFDIAVHAEYGAQVDALAGRSERMPINAALRQELEKVLLREAYRRQAETGSSLLALPRLEDQDPDDRPERPGPDRPAA